MWEGSWGFAQHCNSLGWASYWFLSLRIGLSSLSLPEAGGVFLSAGFLTVGMRDDSDNSFLLASVCPFVSLHKNR